MPRRQKVFVRRSRLNKGRTHFKAYRAGFNFGGSTSWKWYIPRLGKEAEVRYIPFRVRGKK